MKIIGFLHFIQKLHVLPSGVLSWKYICISLSRSENIDELDWIKLFTGWYNLINFQTWC